MTTTPCGIDAFTVNVTSAYNTTKLLKIKEEILAMKATFAEETKSQ